MFILNMKFIIVYIQLIYLMYLLLLYQNNIKYNDYIKYMEDIYNIFITKYK